MGLSMLIVILFFSFVSANGRDPNPPERLYVTNHPSPPPSMDIRNVQHVLFGSCNDESKKSVLWPAIIEKNPQLWVWMGDNIYGDKRAFNEIQSYIPPMRLFREATPEILHEKYSKLLEEPGYRQLIEKVPVIGTWDDHDYGINDGSKDYAYKKESQQLFLDFLRVSNVSLRREQEGVYATHLFGSGDRIVRFILLDVRYHRDNYGTVDGDFLGKEQWRWLENTLKSTTASFNIIVSGIQILPTMRSFGETWNKFPHQRERLLKLITRSRAKGVLLLSGDVHFAEVNANICGEYGQLIEVTSSGMTHSWLNFRAMAFIARLGFTIGNRILVWQTRLKRDAYYGGYNFGGIKFDWEAKPFPQATVSIYDADGGERIQISIASSARYPLDETATTCVAPYPSTWSEAVFWEVVLLALLLILLGLPPFIAYVVIRNLFNLVYVNSRTSKAKKN